MADNAPRWRNPVFRNLAEAAVWAWMCDTVPMAERVHRTAAGRVTIGAGEMLVSERDISAAFGMHRGAVRRLLQRMYDEAMIIPVERAVPHRAGTLVTVNLSYSPRDDLPLESPAMLSERSSCRAVREKVLKMTNGTCHYCSCELSNESGPSQFHVDHVLPVSKGGSDRVSNYVPACRTCNLGKGSKRAAEWSLRPAKAMGGAA